jgi:hypothetical protein
MPRIAAAADHSPAVPLARDEGEATNLAWGDERGPMTRLLEPMLAARPASCLVVPCGASNTNWMGYRAVLYVDRGRRLQSLARSG